MIAYITDILYPEARQQRNINDVLPNDVLGLVFLTAFNEEPEDPTQLSIVISHVCQKCKFIALDTARLWSRIVFQFSDNDQQGPNELFQKPAEFLLRSKETLVDLSVIHLPPSMETISLEKIAWIVSLIKPQAHRWKSLKAYTVNDGGLRALFELLQDARAPNLESLVVRDVLGGHRWTFQAFKGKMPKLKRFSLKGVKVELPFLMELRAVRKMEIDEKAFHGDVDGQVKGICNLLEHTTCLSTLAVGGLSYSFQWSPPMGHATRIIAPSITKLKIVTSGLLAAIISRVEFPSLIEYLDLRPELLRVIHHYNSFPLIRTLSVCNFGSTWDHSLSELAHMLSGFFWLETLSIEAIVATRRLDRDWIKQLGTICPNLQYLTIDYALGMSEEAIRTMVETRIQAGEPMKRLRELNLIRQIGGFDTNRKNTKLWMKWLESNVDVVTLRETEHRWRSGASPTPVFPRPERVTTRAQQQAISSPCWG